jgi:hypothetical protein
MNEAALVLVCKRPAPGIGKQRLAASLGMENAYQIARALLACALEDAAGWPGPVVIAPASAEDAHWAQTVSFAVSSQVAVVPQVSGNLGQRLNALDQTLRARGMERLVFIGSDAPGLCAADYTVARTTLLRNDIALIPASDGGVVLMANRRAWPDLSALPWSGDQLGAALLALCHDAGRSVKTFGQGYDVDEFEDFAKLTAWLQQDQRPARRALLELTENIISRIKIPHA